MFLDLKSKVAYFVLFIFFFSHISIYILGNWQLARHVRHIDSFDKWLTNKENGRMRKRKKNCIEKKKKKKKKKEIKNNLNNQIRYSISNTQGSKPFICRFSCDKAKMHDFFVWP